MEMQKEAIWDLGSFYILKDNKKNTAFWLLKLF
jgi:hypothetical protein